MTHSIISFNYITGFTITHKLRAHDTNINSLEWMYFNSNEDSTETYQVKRNFSQARSTEKNKFREPPKPIVDADDMFDMYSSDHLENEFGPITKSTSKNLPEESFLDDHIENESSENENNENFDFVEACQSLREDIIENNKVLDKENEDKSVELSDIQNQFTSHHKQNSDEISLDGSNASEDTLEEASNHSTLGSNHNEAELAELENTFNKLAVAAEIASVEDVVEDRRKIYLASGAQESFVIIWNVGTGNICKRIQLKNPPGKAAIPSKYLQFHFYNEIC